MTTKSNRASPSKRKASQRSDAKSARENSTARSKGDNASSPEPAGTKQGKSFDEMKFKPGQSGNPAGRPKGSRNKLTTEFFDDFYAAWQEHGAEALKEVAENNPKDFVKAAAMLMPKEFEIKTPLDGLSDDELADLITSVRALVSAGAVGPVGDGAGSPGKPH